MTTRRVRFTEVVKATVMVQQWLPGDVKALPAEDAERFIAAGWGVDADTGEAGVRRPGAAGPIEPDAVVVDLAVPG